MPPPTAPTGAPRTLFLLHEQRHPYYEEPSYLELYLPMLESGLLGETMAHPYQRDLRFARQTDADQAEAFFEDLLDQKLREFRPDLVMHALTWPQESIAPETLQRLKQRHGFKLASVIWDHDESNELLQRLDEGVIRVSDCSIVADSHRRAAAIRARQGPYRDFVNTDSVVFLPMVPPRAVFHPRPERQHEVTISGSSEGHRVAVFEALVARGFAVHRSGGMMPGDALLPIEQYARDLATSRIVVNTQTVGSRVQVKGRVAQCLASGCLLLEQDNPESSHYLQGIEVPRWRGLDELCGLLAHFLAHPDECEALARRTHLQWQARHSAAGFVRTVLATADLDRAIRSPARDIAWVP